MSAGNSAQNESIVSDERIRDALRVHIDRAINVDRRLTRTELSNNSGVNIYAIDAIISRDPAKQRRVAMEDGFSLAYALGDAAVRSLLMLFGWTGCRLGDEASMQPMMIVATAMHGLSTIANAAADNRIDHTEEAECRDAADLIIATVRPLSSARGQAA